MDIGIIIIPSVVVLIGFFFLIRKVMTWYWKIDEIEKILRRIEKNTRKEGVIYSDDENYFTEE
ncbi:TPA: hypothetical protein DCZ46_03105 [Candidatus Campbellbacteria bacterium]|uniref:Uncharacterized protein n=1 Tax=Candidatus Campbellbacteria bacterium RIFCSPLOWO2_01_FULL_34_15 TaxID=1797579 RepID=A0A1F5ENV3_9BACT|nr:MAG: protein of unknown function with transmembrane region [Candidatus Campbellbacteria bacterium GW2011_OD1_34_28]KKP74882.1 MAG: hypothetical protein UR74_C0002G0148 [Candidatus Campbellbacteria bacterium GW2011_GWD2_35_24]KKP75768.1 MAG: hypothetical protein UR75_C0002G0149 [Candidatus Campbellbacteria bacterium GW2011_GWC2_35_28]KKP76984.1 MAG: hypothetical protein UR76_C0002G0185 [Candidatus Campbellbacteria bacterium GW2011_GWC1_35_31]KKP78910.1 MAG: hypothetical protein UR79_C0002G018